MHTITHMFARLVGEVCVKPKKKNVKKQMKKATF